MNVKRIGAVLGVPIVLFLVSFAIVELQVGVLTGGHVGALAIVLAAVALVLAFAIGFLSFRQLRRRGRGQAQPN